MARYKDINYDQTRLLPVSFDKQILPGSFEYTVNRVIDELDLSVFDERYRNDETGRPAYAPDMLLKVILTAYSRGVTSSREIERLCHENVVFMALSGDSQPHFTTIAGFIAAMHEVIEPLFLEVLMVCDAMGLIGKEMFAIDGCKMPSNASKEWSGTHAELSRKEKKIGRAVGHMLGKHREEDERGGVDESMRAREQAHLEKLRQVRARIKKHLAATTDRMGHRGQPIKSNITDPGSATMRTSHGTVQGYIGVAAVDSKHQVIVASRAFGQPQEHRLLVPMIEAIPESLRTGSKLTADAGFCNTENVAYCEDKGIDAYIADNKFRQRDPRFATVSRHKPEHKRSHYFKPEHFHYDAGHERCHCPAGHEMWLQVRAVERKGRLYHGFQAYVNDCRHCVLQSKCMRVLPGRRGRQVSIRVDRHDAAVKPLDRMRRKIDSETGRYIYHQRIGTVEPVFGNVRATKRLDRFSLRGENKVNGQWQMYCLVHNIEKIQRYGLR